MAQKCATKITMMDQEFYSLYVCNYLTRSLSSESRKTKW